MRMPRPEVNGKARLTAWLVITGLFASGTLSFGITNSSPAAASSPPRQTQAPAPVAIRFSPGIPEIVRMVESKVDPQVIRAYIKNSPVAYNPSATELIALKNRGIPEDILTALVQRGAQVKAQARQTAQQGSIPSAPYAYSYPYPVQYAYPAYGGGYPGYSGYPNGGYPYYALPSPPLISFNNSFPTWINGSPVYSGYYVPGYGYLW